MIRASLLALLLILSSCAITDEAHHKSNYCDTCTRDSHGRIKRSHKATHEFKKASPCPATGKSTGACPEYVIDHIIALKRGGADDPSNMQWQTKEAAKAKDRWE
jgi:hypothetical protein